MSSGRLGGKLFFGGVAKVVQLTERWMRLRGLPLGDS